MGRLTQMIAYLNAEKHPDEMDKAADYTKFTITPEAKKVRSEYRKHNKLKSKK